MAVIAELGARDWQRLNKLLESILDAPAGERAERLRVVPAGDADLVPIIQRLLENTLPPEKPRELPGLTQPSLSMQGQSVAATSIDMPGQHIGPYRLVRELGRGGMGTVWLAERDDGVIDRQVALKLPRAEWTDLGLAERMARERRALAELNHPNIAQLYDAGWSEDGRPYLALEYVEGQPLVEHCKMARLDTRARLRVFADVVRAVAHAHARLVIHRDLKPGNVMVTSGGSVKLLDFGIAKLLATDSTTAEETALTRLVGRPLTPAYAAPEQILGRPVSTSADIYALGVMLFELLSGGRPYAAAYASRHALEHAVVTSEPVPPSKATRDKTVVRALRGDLDTIILKALKKQPEQRYETAAALADDIERYLDNRPVRAQADSRAYRLRRFLVRNRLGVASAAVVLVGLSAGLLVALWQAHAAREQAERAEAINRFVLSIIQQADPAASNQTRAADLVLLTTAEQRIARDLAGRPDLQLQARLAIATAYRNRGDFAQARRTLRSAFDEGRMHLPADHLNLLRAQVRGIAWPLVEVADAQAELDTVIERLRRLGDPATPVLIESLIARWSLRISTESATAALGDAREALALAQRSNAPAADILDAASAVALTLGPTNLMQAREMLEVIEPVYRQSTERQKVNASDPALIAAQSTYGLALCTIGRCADGLPLLRDAVASARKYHGADSYAVERAFALLADALTASGDLRGAVRALQEAHGLAAMREPVESLYRSSLAYQLSWLLVGTRRPQTASQLLEEAGRALNSLPPGRLRDGRALWHQFRLFHLSEALGESERALAQGRALLVQVEAVRNETLLLRLRRTLVHSLLGTGDARQAAALAEQLLAAQRAANAAGDLSAFLPELALAKLMLGVPADAVSLTNEAVATRKRFRSELLPLDADTLVIRGRALLALERAAEARADFEQADSFWRDFDPDNPWAAEAAWWLGKSLAATGEAQRGERLMEAMRPRLEKSWRPLHRLLVASNASRSATR